MHFFKRATKVLLLIIAVLCWSPLTVVAGANDSTEPSVDSTIDQACQTLADSLQAAEAELAAEGPVLERRIGEIGNALEALEKAPGGNGDSEATKQKELLLAEREARQHELQFLEKLRIAWRAALDSCSARARFAEELAAFSASDDNASRLVNADVAGFRARLDQVQSALAALDEPETVRNQRGEKLTSMAAESEGDKKRLLEIELRLLRAEGEAARQKRSALTAELTLLEAQLSQAEHAVGEDEKAPAVAVAQPPAADEADAINKKKLAEQLDAAARNRLDFARSRLSVLDSQIAELSEQGQDVSTLRNEHDYWKRVEAYEQRRVSQAQLHEQAAQEKIAINRIRGQIKETEKTVEQLRAQRAEMPIEERQEKKEAYLKAADSFRQEAAELIDRARAEESEILATQQLLPEIEAAEQVLVERLQQAATFAQMQDLSTHVSEMREQLLLDRQQIDLMVATKENVAYAKMRQATLKDELADVCIACAEALVPTTLSFWEEHRQLVNSGKLVLAAVALTYAVKLAIWIIQHLLLAIKAALGAAKLSVKRITTLLKFAASIIKIFVWVFCLVAVLKEFDINYAQSTGAIGLIGLIMASMFQQIVVDFVKGLDIVAGKHYSVGDFVEVNGKFGHVVDFNVKHTRIRTHSGQEFSIPNSQCVPSRRFPDGYVDNYVDITLASRADRHKAKEVLDLVGADINRRVEAVRDKPEMVRRFAGINDQLTLRYLIHVLPGCDWVASQRFIPAAKKALGLAGVEIIDEPTVFFINRIETFRKLFSRRMSEEEIVREVADELSPPTPGQEEQKSEAPASGAG